MAASVELSQSLECPVCLQLFKDPKQLTCGHTLCASCLQDIVDATRTKRLSFLGRVGQKLSSVTIDCPECRTATSIPSGGLSTNYAILDLADKFSVLKISEQRPCNECHKETPKQEQFSCATCDRKSPVKQLLCAACALRRHRLHDIREFAQAEMLDTVITTEYEWSDGKMVYKEVMDLPHDTHQLLYLYCLSLMLLRVLFQLCQ